MRFLQNCLAFKEDVPVDWQILPISLFSNFLKASVVFMRVLVFVVTTQGQIFNALVFGNVFS